MEWWIWIVLYTVVSLSTILIGIVTSQDGDAGRMMFVCPTHYTNFISKYRQMVSISECDVCNGQK